MKSKLQELIGIIFDLNEQKDGKQWFFDFSGHINAISVFYRVKEDCQKCEHCEYKTTYIAQVLMISEIQKVINELNLHVVPF